MKKALWILVGCWIIYVFPVQGKCPSADLTGDCMVDLRDLAVMASQWLVVGDPLDIVWVSINDPGVSGHGGFNGKMSKYETTNTQFCQYLNDALASGDITITNNQIRGANGTNSGLDYAGQVYYDLAGSGWTFNGANNGGATRIHFSSCTLSVDIGYENHPVTYVSWYGAMAFCSYYGYHLPTEWEWQAVADYTGSYKYACGATIDNNMANYQGSIHPLGTTLVGAYGPYGYGLCDMNGNVSEWTNSCYYSDCRDAKRVVRGGSWDLDNFYCQVSIRAYHDLTDTYPRLGFRVCR